METKSRYEVIADLESQKRALIIERDNLNNLLLDKQKMLNGQERRKEDNVRNMDREIADITEGIAEFKKTMAERKETKFAAKSNLYFRYCWKKI